MSCWSWLGDDGKWVQYDSDTMDLLDRAYRKSKKKCRISDTHSVNLRKMVQYRRHDKSRCRDVKREDSRKRAPDDPATWAEASKKPRVDHAPSQGSSTEQTAPQTPEPKPAPAPTPTQTPPPMLTPAPPAQTPQVIHPQVGNVPLNSPVLQPQLAPQQILVPQSPSALLSAAARPADRVVGRISKNAVRLHKDLMNMLPEPNSPKMWEASLINDDLSHWEVKLFEFDPNSRLFKDMKKFSVDHITLWFKFPEAYPVEPPFVMIRKPRVGGGSIFNGGLCVDILMQNWSPALRPSAVTLQIRQLLMEGDAGITGPRSLGEYSEGEARSGFDMAKRAHKNDKNFSS